MKKILFISHDATRTGAPILLLNLCSIIKNDYEIHFLIKNDIGDLKKRFSEAANTFFAKKKYNFLDRIRRRFFTAQKFNLENIRQENYDLIISNTITNGELLADIRKIYNGRMVSYIHELEMATAFFTSKEDLKKLIDSSDSFIVPSNAVKKHLTHNLGIQNKLIYSLPYYIPATNLVQKKEESDMFVIGGAGTVDWRKGADLFLLIASLIFKKQPDLNLRFKWKGASEGFDLERLLYEVKNLGLRGKVEFLDTSDEVGEFYSKIDVFLLTSREDPYPLVVLEAANYSIPTIAFQSAGGAPEFIKEAKGGIVVPFMDTVAMAEEILVYYNNRNLCTEDGLKARNLLRETHQNNDYIKSKFTNIVDERD